MEGTQLQVIIDGPSVLWAAPSESSPVVQPPRLKTIRRAGKGQPPWISVTILAAVSPAPPFLALSTSEHNSQSSGSNPHLHHRTLTVRLEGSPI
jgi:hypothetical protein